MKTGLSINPLLMSIMAQAAEIVKSETTLAPASSEIGVAPFHVGETLFNSDHTKILTLDPTTLKHPLFNAQIRSTIEPYAFGKAFSGMALASENDIASCLSADSVKITWDPKWNSVPQWVIQFLNHPHRKSSVWMYVEYEDLPLLNEKWCHYSIQLGWSWWLNPPKTANEIKKFLDLSKNFWRFWFTHPKSDQWIWPWANILLKDCVELYNKNIVLPKPWSADSRNKNVWLQIEDDAWQALTMVLGGETSAKNLSASVYEWVTKNEIAQKE